MRVADLVLAEKVKIPSSLLNPVHDPKTPERTRQTNRAAAQYLRRQVPVIEATMVAEQVFGGPQMALEDFPCLTPPWPSFWLEYAKPRSATPITPARWGLLVVEADLHTFAEYAQEKSWPVEAERCFGMTLYAEYKSQVVGPCASWSIALDERGIAVQADFVVLSRIVRQSDADEAEFARLMWTGMQTICFLHCRNVHLVDGPKPDPRVQRKQKEKLGRAPLGYSVVKIDPFRTRPVSERAEGGDGPHRSRRLHTVPGHYAHFGDCCPGVHERRGLAFGKLTGMFWVPMHVRGSLEEGAVVHDYRVKL